MFCVINSLLPCFPDLDGGQLFFTGLNLISGHSSVSVFRRKQASCGSESSGCLNKAETAPASVLAKVEMNLASVQINQNHQALIFKNSFETPVTMSEKRLLS